MPDLKLGLQLGYWGSQAPTDLQSVAEEAERLGFKKCVVPHSVKEDRLTNKNSSLKLVPVKTLFDAFGTVF